MAGVDGDGSYWKLLRNVYGAANNSVINKDLIKRFAEYDTIQIDEIALVLILSFVRSDVYPSSSGKSEHRATHSYTWENKANGLGTTKYLYFMSSKINAQDKNWKGFGQSVRCVAK